ncbi:MAG TPA: acetate--CoA ligase family protein, partial [Terriglobales bacterium]|nr:acetate--CoA ligase family protein [Terriglobales bacterium]
AIVGTGGIAASHAKAVTSLADRAELVAAVDVDLARAKEFAAKWDIPAVYASLRELLAAGGVPVVPARLATTAAEAVEHAVALGLPAVLKVASPDVAHKTEAGGVALDLRRAEDVAAAFHAVTTSARRAVPGARVDGVLVSPMRPGGVELLVSVRRDPAWGPVLAVGLGGVWVEVLGDTSLRLLPAGPDDVEEALGELRGAALLRGARGRAPVSARRVAEVAVAIAAVAERLGEDLDTLEVNPLRAAGDEVEVLDALVVWRDATSHEEG